MSILRRTIIAGGGVPPYPDTLFTSGEVGDWFKFNSNYRLYYNDDPLSNVRVQGGFDRVVLAEGRRGECSATASGVARPRWVGTEIDSIIQDPRTMTAEIPVIDSADSVTVLVVGRGAAGSSVAESSVTLYASADDPDTTAVIYAGVGQDRATAKAHGESVTNTGSISTDWRFCFAERGAGTDWAYSNTFQAETAGTFAGARTNINRVRIKLDGQTSADIRSMLGCLYINRLLTSQEKTDLLDFYGL